MKRHLRARPRRMTPAHPVRPATLALALLCAALPAPTLAAAQPTGTAQLWAHVGPEASRVGLDGGPLPAEPAAAPADAASTAATASEAPARQTPTPAAASAPLRTAVPVSITAANAEARRAAGRLGELPDLLRVPATLALGDASAANRPALTLAAALPRGVANSREVQAAEAHRESYEHTVRAAQGAGRPQVTLRVSQGRGRLDTLTTTDELDRNDSNLTLRQALYDRPARLEMDRQSTLLQSAELQWRSAVSNASVEVASAYLQALQSRLTLELSRDHEARLGELFDYVSKRAEAGGTSTAERDRVKARVANARAQMADARATLRTALRQLESLMGEAPQALQMSLPTGLLVPNDAPGAFEEARLANADLASERREIEAVQLEAKGHGARRLPTVALEVTQNNGVNASGTIAKQRDTRALLVLNWTLMDGGTARSQERAAEARQREKALRLEETERKLRQELDGAYANLEAVGERYAALRTELEANATVVEAFQAQLVGGNRQLLDVLDAYQRLYQTRLDLTGVVVGEVQNQFKVAHLTGRLFNLGWRP